MKVPNWQSLRLQQRSSRNPVSRGSNHRERNLSQSSCAQVLVFIPHFADSEQHVSIALSITPLANPLDCALCNPRRRPVKNKAISALRYRTLASFEKGLPGEDGSQYDFSIATLSTHIVTAGVRQDKLADRIGSGNWASQVTGLVGKTLFYLFLRADVACVGPILLIRWKSAS